MREENKWSELSNEEFVSILLNHASDKSWTVAEIFELEKRGFEILDEHSEIQVELKDRRDKFMAKLLEATKPTLDAIKRLQSNLEVFQKTIPEINLPKLPKYEIPILDMQGITGPVAPKIASSSFVKSSEDGSLKDLAIHNLLQRIADTTSDMANSLKPGLAYWALFVFSAISAVGVIIGFFFK